MVDRIFLYDFSNNYYSINNNRVTYKPMTPEMSSSGTYSGGELAEVEINQEQFDKILIFALNLGIQTKMHRDKRAMMTAQLTLYSGDNSYRYILGKSETLNNLLSALKAIINQ